MRPDAVTLRVFLARVARRLLWRSIAEGAALGIAAAALLGLAGWPAERSLGWHVGAAAALAIIGIIILLVLQHDVGTVAARIERRVPESRNLVLTADELARGNDDGYVAGIVLHEAARFVGRLDPAALFPASRSVAALIASTAMWSVFATPAGSVIAPAVGIGRGRDESPAIDHVEVVVTPPAYSGRPAQTLNDPERIEALAGSRLTVNMRAHATRISLETITAHDTLAAQSRDAFHAALVVDADGYVALEPAAGSRIGARRLIGLTVIPDARPTVKITAPGHDVRLADGHQTLSLAIEAGDDIALASLRLRYTKVAGSGERFTFTEGELPIAIARKDSKAWTARATWKLDSLALEPGDMVVYRAVAADHKPGAAPTESDAFIAEVNTPGGQAAPGFDVDPDQDRYAVSQQMVILKTERLLAKRASMSAADFGNESQEIAAEQRKVRAEFVFMLGGELADAPDVAGSMTEINEEQEAAGESDLLAGRNANAGHTALVRAIRAMSRAAAALTVAHDDSALTHEHEALTQLESAFSRARILLRAFTTRERLDLSRRLTGSLTDVARDIQPTATPELSARVTSLRRTLSDVAALAGRRTLSTDDATQASMLAERVLKIDASSKSLQDVSAQLASAATAIRSDRASEARNLLDRAVAGLSGVLRGALLDAPRASPSLGADRMKGALTDALRSGRGGR